MDRSGIAEFGPVLVLATVFLHGDLQVLLDVRCCLVGQQLRRLQARAVEVLQCFALVGEASLVPCRLLE
jgi:hypothetical protein